MTSFIRRPSLASWLLAAAFASSASGSHAAEALPPLVTGAADGRVASWTPRLGRVRPVVAVVGENTGTELVDFMVPFGILADSGAADVIALSTGPGPLQLRPALRVQLHETIALFDERIPEGADYVIVPAVIEDHVADPALLAWLRTQSGKGAVVVSICDGALVVANAGLFEGRRATGHWATAARRRSEHAGTRWLSNLRYVADGNVVSSAGVSAAIPTSLALVEAIGGTAVAARTAARLGATGWEDAHNSEQFRIGAETVVTFIANRYLKHSEPLVVPVADGVDDIALALTLDAYGRTMRSPVSIRSPDGGPVRSSHGLFLLPPDSSPERPARELSIAAGPPLASLDRTMTDIGLLYGAATQRYVALEMEYAPAYAKH